jgi:tetratricopeptide (TPR) repeat protein
MNDPQRFDSILRILVVALLVVVVAFGGYFGYTVYRDRVAEENSIPALRLAKALQAQVKQNPNDAVLRVRLGEALGAAGRTQQAIEQLNAALKIEPKHTGAFMDLGVLAMSAKRYDEAKTYFDKVVEYTSGTDMADANNRREEALFNLGVLAFRQKNYDEAVGNFKAALRIRNDASDTYMYLAQSLEALGQNADAETAVRYALRFDPNFAQGRYLLGKLLLADGNKLSASAEIGRALELSPNSPEPKALAAQIGDPAQLFQQASAEASSDPAAALEAATIAFNLDRKDYIPAAKLAAGLSLAKGDKKGALNTYKRALEVAPTDTQLSAAIKALSAKPKKKTTKK